MFGTICVVSRVRYVETVQTWQRCSPAIVKCSLEFSTANIDWIIYF